LLIAEHHEWQLTAMTRPTIAREDSAPQLGFMITIRDDNRGIPEIVPLVGGSLDLPGMGERVHCVRGTLKIHGRPDAGTTVSIPVPRHPPPS
jgi:nitrate/nitrite-specific signal transduction histidine kinase